jgi:hypothetical protein
MRLAMIAACYDRHDHVSPHVSMEEFGDAAGLRVREYMKQPVPVLRSPAPQHLNLSTELEPTGG